jgi:hypothetical protein
MSRVDKFKVYLCLKTLPFKSCYIKTCLKSDRNKDKVNIGVSLDTVHLPKYCWLGFVFITPVFTFLYNFDASKNNGKL